MDDVQGSLHANAISGSNLLGLLAALRSCFVRRTVADNARCVLKSDQALVLRNHVAATEQRKIAHPTFAKQRIRIHQ